jgi:hypothetical protein
VAQASSLCSRVAAENQLIGASNAPYQKLTAKAES